MEKVRIELASLILKEKPNEYGGRIKSYSAELEFNIRDEEGLSVHIRKDKKKEVQHALHAATHAIFNKHHRGFNNAFRRYMPSVTLPDGSLGINLKDLFISPYLDVEDEKQI